MRDREYLMLLRDSAQGVTDLQADAASDSGIDLVEDQSRHSIDASENRFECQHHTRELAARSHTRQRPLFVTDIEGHAILDIFAAFGYWLIARDQSNRESAVRHPELRQQHVDCFCELLPRGHPHLGQSLR